MAQCNCYGCGRCVYRSRTSAAEIYCQQCRRSGNGPTPSHGTTGTYRRGCRCDPCRGAARGYYRRRQDSDNPIVHSKPKLTECCERCSAPTVKPNRFCSLSCSTSARYEPERQRRLPILHPNPDPLTTIPAKHPAVAGSRKHPHLNGSLFVQGSCGWCETSFVGLAADWERRSRYCSPRCLKKAGKARRGALRGSRFQPSSRLRLEIGERDHWICQLCSEPVVRDSHYLDDWHPTLDHVIPQSFQLFPDHSALNLRLTHRWCNAVRGDGSKYDDKFFAA